MFTPKVVHQEESLPTEPAFADDAAELELPADLALLAGRLAREAAVLSECYPADGVRPGATPVRLAEKPTNPRSSDSRAKDSAGDRGHARWFLAPALMLLVGVAASAALAWYNAGEEAAQVQDDSTASWSVSYRPEPGSRAASGSPVPESAGSPEVESGAGAVDLSPAAFVHELTGPEMEGFLDLLEGDDAADSRLSI